MIQCASHVPTAHSTRTIPFLFFCLSICTFPTFAQDSTLVESYNEAHSHVNFGLGYGLDYGGLGIRFAALPIQHIALFAGLGYNFDRLGFNGGLSFQILPDNRVCPVVLAMYGYNGTVIVRGATATDLNKTYYGPSVGAGVHFRDKKRLNFINVEILVPFRSQEFKDYHDNLKSNPLIRDVNDTFPITFAVGYHLAF